MEQRLQVINECFAADNLITVRKPFVQNNQVIVGEILISADSVELAFVVEILTPYPMQFHDHETIRFINKELIEFNHVNQDGSICVHTFHSPNLATKIALDTNSLKHWIKRYYINKEKDQHYEHIVVPETDVNGEKLIFLFTDVEHDFTKNEYGTFNYSILSSINNADVKFTTAVVQCFNKNKKQIWCQWSSAYKNLKREEGLFLFIENPPVVSKRFAATDWKELEKYVDQQFLKYLYDVNELYKKNTIEHRILPLLFGYRINEKTIHWQTALIQTKNFPNYSKKVLGTTFYLGMFNSEEINWAQSKNCSYGYFFGRGVLHSKFTNRKVMIIGLGAIGSIIATTLVRGGVRSLCIVDYDIKEPENVCRSEYIFKTGVSSKVDELSNRLLDISPFVEVQTSESLFDFAKFIFNENEGVEILKRRLQEHDLIIDCSADHEVSYILDSLNIDLEIISLSITNHAEELICTVNPDLYRWSINIHDKLRKENEDLYNPTGCWNPTFKASYNDVATLVQFAVKHINSCYVNELPVRNFYLSSNFEQGLTIKLNQF